MGSPRWASGRAAGLPGLAIAGLAWPATALAESGAPHRSDGGLPGTLLVLGAALVAAKLAGALAERFRQPGVMGELLAGVLLGPSVLGRLTALHLDPGTPEVWLFAQVGVVLLLLEVGLETDLRAMLRAGRTAALVAAVGVVVPMALGALAVMAFSRAGWLAAPPGGAPLLAIFLGATLTATSVGITARVLRDLGRLHGGEARVLLGAAVIDDIIGLAILSAVTALGAVVAAGKPLADALRPAALLVPLVVATAFLAAAVAVGRLVAPPLFDLASRLRSRGSLLVFAIALSLALAWATAQVGLALLLGGFAAGLVLSKTRQFDLIEERVKTVSDLFTPVFFLVVGANVDVAFLDVTDPARRRGLLLAGVLLVAAVAGKLVSGLAARGSGISRLVVGIGMIPRGEVGLIFAQAGLHVTLPTAAGPTPLLSRDLYSAITLVVLITTFVSPPLLRAAFARVEEPTP